MQFMNNLFSLNGIINTFLLLCTLVGGFFAFKQGLKKKSFEALQETISILQSQVEAIRSSLEVVEKRNRHLEYVIETVQEALKKRGMIISIDGDLVTITDTTRGSATSIRKPRLTRFKPKEEDDD